MRVPFVNLNLLHQQIATEIREGFADIFSEMQFVNSRYVEEFEEAFADYCDAQACVAVGSGTSALHLALLAHGIGKGHTVITVPNTFVATVEAICHAGAEPLLVDIDPETYTLDASQIADLANYRSKAVIPVHLYGQPADVYAVRNQASKYALQVIEDACQSHGARYAGHKIGADAVGNTSCFSFYPSKNLGAYGDAGAVVANDAEVADRLRALRDHGSKEKYHHEYIGFTSRMSSFQAVVLRAKLRYLDDWNDRRRESARMYYDRLKDCDQVVLPIEAEERKHVYHLYVIRVSERRDELRRYLGTVGVETGLHYPTPIHLQPAYSHLGYGKGDFPVAERYASEILSLPMHPMLTEQEIHYVCKHISLFSRGGIHG